VLGLIDAALGRKEEALREGHRAVELLPLEKDPINGIAMVKYLAMIAAWAGDKDLACEQLAVAIRPPSRLTYGQLKLLPFGIRCVANRALKKSSPLSRQSKAGIRRHIQCIALRRAGRLQLSRRVCMN
jgi:hypothetical protein